MHGRVLVVDDDDDFRESLARLLELWGLEVRGARNGREALQLLRAERLRPCVILLDLAMPVMSGEAFRAEQLADAELASVPVVLLSANADLERRAVCLAPAGSVPKPVHFDALKAALAPYCADLRD